MCTQFRVKPVGGKADIGPVVRMNNNTDRSKRGWIRFLFEQGEAVRCYEVCLKPLNLGMFAEPFDLRLQMDADKLSLSEIAGSLRHCAESHDDVEKVSLHYTGHRYSVVVVLRELCEERLPEIYDSFEHTCQEYGTHSPVVTVLGPQQRDSFALSAVDSYLVYSNGGALNLPTPPLG